jgi:hypothetical protein
MRFKCEVEEKHGAKETLRQNLRILGCRSRHWGGVAQESVPFYSALAPVNLARNTQIYLFTLMIASHNGKISKGQNTSFTLASVSVGRLWEFRSLCFAL